MYIYNKSSLPIGLSEFLESEPIGICKNINPIHDQGCGYHYLDYRPFEMRISSDPDEDDLNL